MEDFPPYVRSQLKKLENSLTKAAKLEDRIWSFFSESTLDPKLLFKAVTHIVSSIILTHTKIDKIKILNELFNQIKYSGNLLDAFLNAFYETSTKADDPIVTANANDRFVKYDWSCLKKPFLIVKPIPQNGCFDKFIINIVLMCTPIQDIAESKYLQISDPDIIKSLTVTSCLKFVDSWQFYCDIHQEPLPNFIFTQEKTISALCSKRLKYDMLDKCLQISFEKEPTIIDSLKKSWDLLSQKQQQMIFLSHILVPFADSIPDEIVSYIINSNKKLSKQGFDYNLFISNHKCMMLATPRILIDICKFDVDMDIFMNYASEILKEVDQKQFLKSLFDSKKSSLPRTSTLFQKLLDEIRIEVSELNEVISLSILNNPEIVCAMIDDAMNYDNYAQILANNDILFSVVDCLNSNSSYVLSILGKASIHSNISQIWATSDICSLLIDEIISKQERGMEIETFFEDLFMEANDETIIAILPSVSSYEPLLERLAILLEKRFPPDSNVIQTLDQFY